MAIILEGWRAVFVAIVFSATFCWAGYATSKVFLFSERDIKQRKYIKALEQRIAGGKHGR